jgi:hypothetical protein
MRRLNNGQTGESGGVLPQTNWNIFVRISIEEGFLLVELPVNRIGI